MHTFVGHWMTSYKGRTRKRLLTTQCYIEGKKIQEPDGLLKRMKATAARDTIIVPFEKVRGSKINEFNARFDIVIGLTPEDQP